MTVTLGAPKLPLVLPPAETRAGDIVIADIGIPLDVIESLERSARRAADAAARCASSITPRAADTHKGDLRPRADRCRVARQDRRRPSGGGRRAPIRGRAGHHRDRRRCQPIVAAHGRPST